MKLQNKYILIPRNPTWHRGQPLVADVGGLQGKAGASRTGRVNRLNHNPSGTLQLIVAIHFVDYQQINIMTDI